MKETGGEEMYSSGDGPSKGATKDLKKPSWRTLVSSEQGDTVSNVDKMRPIERHQCAFLFDKSAVYRDSEFN
jgi:hypothetical protein